MPHTTMAATMPLPAQPEVELKAQVPHPALTKKMQRCTIYASTGVDKLSTKWKKQRRLLIATPSLLLVCKPEGDVRRVIDFSDIEELAMQQEGTETLMLVKLSATPLNEPDLLAVAHVDKRATHPPASFLGVVAALVKQRKQFTGVQYIPSGGLIKGMARLGHNPISAKEKLKAIAAKPPPQRQPQQWRPQPPQAAAAVPREASPASVRMEDPLGSPQGPDAAEADDSSASADPHGFQPRFAAFEQPEMSLALDSRPTSSDASGRTPHMKPLNYSAQSDAPLSPLESTVAAGHMSVFPGPLDDGAGFGDDTNVIAASRMRAHGGEAGGAGGRHPSAFLPKFDEIPAHSSTASSASEQGALAGQGLPEGQRRKPRSVSFSTPTNGSSNEALTTIVAQNRAAPVMKGAAAAMPPVKSLPEDDEGGCGWTEHKDPSSGLMYYHNEKEGKSTWHEPEELRRWKEKSELMMSGGVGAAAVPSGPARSGGTLPGPAGVLRSKPEVLLQHQHRQRMPACDEDSSEDDASSDSDDMMMPAERTRSAYSTDATSLQGIKRLLDGPPVRMSVPSRLPRNDVQPSFDEQPITDVTPGPLSGKAPVVGLRRIGSTGTTRRTGSTNFLADLNGIINSNALDM